ncbi:competence type IV pilus minor pilin ComGF [Bacillus sp. FSL K6-3431]|uniref:competence type IV pilus minor pilin ComGF n=1 Tax=Bacillus sp. FSL K6-3431 TaxID=2921500 RepID=UPI0030FBFA52
MLVCIMKNWKDVLNNDSGFTLLESILSMLILMTIMTILPLIFYAFSAIDRSVNVEDDFEWNLFLIQFRNEVKNADRLIIYSNRVFIDKPEQQSIYYEQYGTSIRRRVNNFGHEIVLQELKKAKFEKDEGALLLQVEFLNGTNEEARISIPVMEEEEPLEMKKESYIQLH